MLSPLILIHQGLQADGITVLIAKLCRWFDVPRRKVYLQAGEIGAQGRCEVRRADQGADRGVAIVWLQDGRASVGIQLEHRAAGVPVDGLAGSQAANRL